MEDLVRYRAMESLCRQSAVFRPLESWRLLAEAEMWHHKALEEITSRSIECNGVPPTGALAQSASLPNPRERSRLLAGGDFCEIRRTWRLDGVEEGWNLALPFGLFVIIRRERP